MDTWNGCETGGEKEMKIGSTSPHDTEHHHENTVVLLFHPQNIISFLVECFRRQLVYLEFSFHCTPTHQKMMEPTGFTKIIPAVDFSRSRTSYEACLVSMYGISGA